MNFALKSWCFHATIVRTTRRVVTITDEAGNTFNAFNPPRSLDITVGDLVLCEKTEKDIIITKIEQRKNCLRRSVPEREKRLAANLDHLFIISAPPPLFNPSFIDRISVAAATEEIPCTLIVNKTDLLKNSNDLPLSDYIRNGFNVLLTSAKDKTGIDSLKAFLNTPSLLKVALAGVSGVGKSSLLNILIPDASSRVADISKKTGQGKQTTSSGFAHTYFRPNSQPLFLIDLPGIQYFGLAHISKEQLRRGFPEFKKPAILCQFNDCTHTAEPQCEIKKLVETAELSASRYKSYLDILQELRAAKPY